MGKWLLAASAILISAVLVIPEADARRFGGARSLGAQRNVTAPPASTPAKPAQQAAAGQQAGQAAAAQRPASGLAKWFPMLGGLALGGMLGWLLATNGGSFLLLALLAIAAVMLFRMLARGGASTQTMQYAGGGRETVPIEPRGALPVAGSSAAIPAGFDAPGFLRGAKMNFARLQMASDRGNLEEIREFTTPELYDALAADLRGRGGAAQQTDVSDLDAQLLEVVTEGGQHWASVRFTGMVREAPGASAEAFQEIWNLAKPVDGSSGWLLAGIQQVN